MPHDRGLIPIRVRRAGWGPPEETAERAGLRPDGRNLLLELRVDVIDCLTRRLGSQCDALDRLAEECGPVNLRRHLAQAVLHSVPVPIAVLERILDRVGQRRGMLQARLHVAD